MFEGIRRALGLDDADDRVPVRDPAEVNQEETVESTSGLPWDLRVHCFIGCLFLSLLCSALGSVMIFSAKITGFTVMISIGNIISIIGTFFLSSPLKQLKKMFEKGRLIATLLYIVMIVLALVAGLVLRNPVLALIFVVGEYLAMIWYTASYIPFGRDLIQKCCCGCLV